MTTWAISKVPIYPNFKQASRQLEAKVFSDAIGGGLMKCRIMWLQSKLVNHAVYTCVWVYAIHAHVHVHLYKSVCIQKTSSKLIRIFNSLLVPFPYKRPLIWGQISIHPYLWEYLHISIRCNNPVPVRGSDQKTPEDRKETFRLNTLDKAAMLIGRRSFLIFRGVTELFKKM